MFSKDKRLLNKLLNFYYEFDFLLNNEIKEYNFINKLEYEEKKFGKLKLIITLILIINVIFRGVLLFLKSGSIFQYVFLIITSVFFYMIMRMFLTLKKDNMIFTFQTENGTYYNDKGNIEMDIPDLKSVIEEYKNIHIQLRANVEVNNTCLKEDRNFYGYFMRLGKFCSIFLTLVYVISCINTDEGLNGAIVFSILMIIINMETVNIDNNIKRKINDIFKFEINNYEYNMNLLKDKYKTFEVEENHLSFQTYSEILYMLLDLYQVSIEYEFLRNEDIEYLSNEYFAKINKSLNTLTDTNIKNRVQKEFNKLKSFMSKNQIDIYNGLELYIGELYKDIKNLYPNQVANLRVEDYCFTESELESLVLLCE